MALSKIRRLSIAVVGFLLFVNLILLGVAKFGSTQASAGPTSYVVDAWVEKADVAQSLKAELEAAGRSPKLTEEKKEVQVPNGFRLVMTGDPDLLKAVEATLKFKKQPVKLVAGGTELQLGGVFPDKAKAEARARAIQKQENVVFQVAESFKPVSKKLQRITVAGLDQEGSAAVEALFEGKAVEVKVEAEEPANPAGSPAGEG